MCTICHRMRVVQFRMQCDGRAARRHNWYSSHLTEYTRNYELVCVRWIIIIWYMHRERRSYRKYLAVVVPFLSYAKSKSIPCNWSERWTWSVRKTVIQYESLPPPRNIHSVSIFLGFLCFFRLAFCIANKKISTYQLKLRPVTYLCHPISLYSRNEANFSFWSHFVGRREVFFLFQDRSEVKNISHAAEQMRYMLKSANNTKCKANEK